MRPPVGLRYPSPMSQALGMNDRDVLPIARNISRGESPYRDYLEGAQVGTGLENLSPTPTDFAIGTPAPNRLVQPQQLQAPRQPLQSQIAYSPSTGMFAVNEFVFNERDAAGALESQKYLDKPAPIPGKVASDWQRVYPEEYAALIERIKNPSLTERAAKSFEAGAAGLGVSTGAALQLLGAERLGGDIVKAGQKRAAELSPYTPEFTDVLKGEEGLIDWFVSAIGQAGPSILESIAAAAVGAGAGLALGAPGGPVSAGATSVGGAVAGLFGKKALRDKLVNIAKKRANNVALSADELKTLRTAAAIGGATATSYLNSASLLSGEAYNEMRQAGVDPDDVRAKLLAVGAGNLGALPELFLEGKLVADVFMPKATKAGFVRRTITGALGYGAAEGLTEAGQEALSMGATSAVAGKEYDPDVAARLINSFAAGFAPGLIPGALANLRTATDQGTPTDLTSNKQVPTREPIGYPTEGGPLFTTQGVPVGTQMELFSGYLGLPQGGVQPPLFENLPEQAPPIPGAEAARQYTLPGLEQGPMLPLGTRQVPAPTGPTRAPIEYPTEGGPLFATQGIPFDEQIEMFGGNLGLPPGQASLFPNLPEQAPPVSGAEAARQYDLLTALQTAQEEDAAEREAAYRKRNLRQREPLLPFAEAEISKRRPPAGQRALLAKGRPEATPAAPLEQRVPSRPTEADYLQPLSSADQANLVQAQVQWDTLYSGLYNPDGTLAVPPEQEARFGFWSGQYDLEQAVTKSKKAELKRKAEARARREEARARKEEAEEAARREAEEKLKAEEAAKRKEERAKKAAERLKKAKPAPEPARPSDDAVKRAKSLIAAVDAKRGVPSNPIIINNIARNLGLEVDAKAQMPDTIARIREKLNELSEPPPEPPPKGGAKLKKGTPSAAEGPSKKPSPVSVAKGKQTRRSASANAAGAAKAAADAEQSQQDLGVPKKPDVPKKQAEVKDTAELVIGKEVQDIVDSQAPSAVTEELSNELEYLIKYWGDPSFRAERDAGIVSDIETMFASGGVDKTFAFANGRYRIGEFFKDGKLNVPKIKSAYDTHKKESQGKLSRTDGTPIDAPVSVGKLRLLVSSMVGKMAQKPDVSVVANVEELKRTDPELYQRALDARPDLDTVQATGLSFGKKIILFSDNIRTEQEARFVLAHEAMGHFGLRSIMTQEELNKALDDLFENSDTIRYTAMRKMEAFGINKREAIEEALSDLAAVVDTNALYRIWSYIKRALNKLTGIKFGDEEARRLVWQARRYVRSGEAGVTTAEVIQDGAKEMAVEYEVGMFSRVGAGQAKADMIGALYSTSATAFSGSQVLRDFRARAADVKRWVSKGVEQFATADEKAMRSLGYELGMSLYTAAAQLRQQILTEAEGLTKYTNEGSFSQEDRDAAEKLLAFANIRLRDSVTDKMLAGIGNLITIDPVTGETSISKENFDKASGMGRLDIDTVKKGFVAEDIEGVQIKSDPMPDLKEDSPVWKIYTEQRNVVNFTALELLRSVYKEQYNKLNTSIQKIARLTSDEKLSEQDIIVLRRVTVDYLNIYNTNATYSDSKFIPDPESVRQAEEFITEVLKTLHSDEKVSDWQSGNPEEIAGQYQGAKYKYIAEAAPRLRKLGISKETQINKVLPLFQNAAFDNERVVQAELTAKNTIATGYVPFVRRGKFYVRASPVDQNGKRVALPTELEHIIPYIKTDDAAVRNQLSDQLQKVFANNTYEIADAEGNVVSVRWKVETGEAATSAATTEDTSPAMLIRQLGRYNIKLDQRERERLITALADFNSAARRNLRRTGNPGWDKNTIRNIADWVRTFSNIAGKNEYSYQITDVLDNNKLWTGDADLLRSLYDNLKEAEASGNKAAIMIAKDRFERYANQYVASAPTSSAPVKLGGMTFQGKGMGARYRDDMKELLRWFSRSADAVISTEDMLGEKGSALMAGTAIMQLGGNIATAAASVTSLPTHSVSYLAFRNAKRGFGGGFGLPKTMVEMSRAISNVGSLLPRQFTDVDFMKKMVAEGTHKNYGLTADEAVFLLDALSDGTTLAAQANALMDHATGKIGQNLTRKGINSWMYMFVATDAMNRRVTALTAYRLYKERMIAAKGNDKGFTAKDPAALQDDPDYKYAADQAKFAVIKTQGEHGAFNRPKIARGNLLRYPFMYQQIVVLTVQLMRNLPPAGQLYILMMIWMMSGIKGIPGEDDFADLLDTLMQKFNVKWEGLDRYMAKTVDEYLPGFSPIAMRGLVDGVLGGSVSIKTGFGDIIPLTGAFRAGANMSRELEDFAGPVWSAYAGLVGTATSTLKWAGSTVGLGDKSVTITDILRDSPISGLKGVIDGLVYLDTGKVINSKGEIISEDLTAGLVLSRMVGLYPAEATLNYDVVRMGRNLSEYTKAIKAEYVLRYKRAKAYGDAEQVRAIIQDVRDWNETARGTVFFIKDFVPSAERAYRESQRAPAERFLRTVSKSNQQASAEMLAALGID